MEQVPGNESADVFSLRELTEEEFNNAIKKAGENIEDTYAILLKDGSFTFREGSWDLKTSSATEDMVAMSYLGKGERQNSGDVE